MEGATPMAGKPMPLALHKRAVNSNKEPKQTTSQEDKSPPRKKKSPSDPSPLESADSFEATATGTSREISLLVSKFAKVLSERAVADTSQMKELDGILTEARNLESYLREKKSHLRQTLALISDKLLG